jgi:hypothetical protein
MRPARPRARRDLPKEKAVVRSHSREVFLPIEERIRRAGAERSVEVGYAIGDALGSIANALRRYFAPAPARRPVPVRAHRLAHHR